MSRTKCFATRCYQISKIRIQKEIEVFSVPTACNWKQTVPNQPNKKSKSIMIMISVSLLTSTVTDICCIFKFLRRWLVLLYVVEGWNLQRTVKWPHIYYRKYFLHVFSMQFFFLYSAISCTTLKTKTNKIRQN